MYSCQLHLYLTGNSCRAFEVIKKMPPLENFTHIFSESDRPEDALVSEADVIVANMADIDIKETLQILISDKDREAQIILLADKNQMQTLINEPVLENITDIWINPMSDEELNFRFLRWQRTYKMSKDFWQTSQYLEVTINNIPSLIWYKDKNGIHKKVNDSFCKAVNKTKKQIEGRRHAYIWNVEHDDPACIESEKEVMSNKQTCVFEEVISAGEDMKILTTYKSPLYNLDGNVMGTVGVAIDVTQERAYKEEITKKNQTLETIFTTIDCGVMRHTVDGSHVLSINKAALNILGYQTQEELMADGFNLIAASVMDEDKGKLKKCINKLKKDGDTVSVEYRVQHKDGKILHVMGNIKLFEENGELIYQRFLLDCTAQKLQEKKNEKRQLELVQALSIDFNLVCFVDPVTGKVMTLRNEGHGIDYTFNDKLLLEESMEQYIQEWVYEEDKEMLRQAVSLDTIKMELTKENPYYVNYRKCKDNKIIYFQMKAVGVGIGNGSRGIVLGFRSVDGEIRKEMEQNSFLEEVLLQANKASKAKSVFLSNMSHDIRTPMNAIVGFSNLAVRHINQKEQVLEYLRKIMTSGNHLLNLINDVLDMSYIESGKIHLEEKPCSLPEILHGLCNILQGDIHAKKLELHIDTVDIVDEVIYCDKLRLNQVLLNLLSNSIKYTDEGGVINVRIIEKSEASTEYANYEFYIKDNGIGMSPEFVERIFEPFEREKNSTISGIQGTGLGMSITKNIIDMMGGSISVKSEKGVGTEFIVSFTFRLYSEKREPVIPELRECLNSIMQPNMENTENDTNKTVKYRTERILLVEDIELNQEIAVAILEDAGFITEVAENGRVAVDMVKQSEPGYYQVVLMDVQMPVLNGYEATQEIRSLKNKKLASIPIIAMTANAFEEDRQAALKYGMNAHIAKPIDVPVLLKTLDMVL